MKTNWILEIHGTNVLVEEVEPNEFDKTQFGQSDTRRRKMWISSVGDQSSKIQTILHEYWHFYEADFVDEFEEAEIQKRTMSLYWFLTANGVDLSPLLGASKGKKKRWTK